MELIHIMWDGLAIPDKLKNLEGNKLSYICIPKEQYEIAYSDYGTGQSLERIIERGGFGVLELAYYYGKEKWDHIVWFGYGNKYPEHIWEWTRVKLEFPSTIEELKKTGYKWTVLDQPTYELKCKPKAIFIFKDIFQHYVNNCKENIEKNISKEFAQNFVEYFDNIIKEEKWW